MSDLRCRSGYTLTEMLVVIIIISIVGATAIVGITVSNRVSRMSILQSRFSLVSDTINISLKDMLVDSDYQRTEDGTVYFVSEKYSGWEMSLGISDGYIIAVIYDEIGGTRDGLLLSAASYAEFTVTDFSVIYSGGNYNCNYTLDCDLFSEEVEFVIAPLNQAETT